MTAPGPADDLPAESCVGLEWPKLFRNGFVIPHWIGRSNEFWYARQLSSGVEYRVVNAATGVARPAFQASELIAALVKAGAAEAEARDARVEDLSLTPSPFSARVTAGQESYDCAGEPMTCRRGVDPARGASPAPNGLLAVLTRGGNLWLRDLWTGHETPLTRDGQPDAGYGVYADTYQTRFIPRSQEALSVPLRAYWAPDSRHVIVSFVDQRGVKPYPYVEYAPRDGDLRPRAYAPRIPLLGEPPATFALFVFDVVTGAAQRLEFPYEQLLPLHTDWLPIDSVWWTSDSQRLFAFAHAVNMSGAYLFEVDPSSGKTKVVIEEHDVPWAHLNSSAYNTPNVRLVENGRQVIWFSERDGWGHLYLYDTASGTLQHQITRGAWLVRDIISVDEARRVIYFTASGREAGNPYDRYLYRVNFDGSELKLLTPEPADHLLTGPDNAVTLDGISGYQAISPDGQYVVYNTSPLGRGGAAVIRTTDGVFIAEFETVDASDLYAQGYQDPEEFVVKAADGVTPLWGVLYKPIHLNPEWRYPVMDAQYASFLVSTAPRNLLEAVKGAALIPPRPAALANCGFAVVSLDARGTANRSREFNRAGYQRLDTMNLEDHIAAIRQLAQRFPWMDTERVGIYGASFGGYTVLRAMLRFPDFFKAGVAGVFAADWQTLYPTYEYLQYEGEPRYGENAGERSPAGERPAHWAHLSSSALVKNLKGRLMLVIAGLDEAVLPGGEMQFVVSLMRANKDFDLIFLPQADHRSGCDLYVGRRIVKFFQTHLGAPVK